MAFKSEKPHRVGEPAADCAFTNLASRVAETSFAKSLFLDSYLDLCQNGKHSKSCPMSLYMIIPEIKAISMGKNVLNSMVFTVPDVILRQPHLSASG